MRFEPPDVWRNEKKWCVVMHGTFSSSSIPIMRNILGEGGFENRIVITETRQVLVVRCDEYSDAIEYLRSHPKSPYASYSGERGPRYTIEEVKNEYSFRSLGV